MLFSTKNPLSKPLACALSLTFALSLLTSADSFAQVAISATVEEIYDDNIFLEDDEGLPELTGLPPELAALITKDNDGDPDSDFITHGVLSISGAIPLSRHFKTAAEARVGAFIFAEESEESRATVDSILDIEPGPSILPEPFAASFRSALQAGVSDVGIASGTAARQIQTHDASANVGVQSWPIFKDTYYSLYYTFLRHDFLGEWTFEDRDERREEDGSDFISNTVGTSIDHDLTPRLSLSLRGAAQDLNFTNVEDNDGIGEKDSSDLNRKEYNASFGMEYALNEKVTFKGSVGVDFTDFEEQPSPLIDTVVNPDGSTSEVVRMVDDSETSLIFSAGVDYTPSQFTRLDFGVSQSRATDINGNRVIVRSASFNSSYSITDSLRATLGGLFSQFKEGDDLGDSEDRYEATVALRYALSRTISISLGWNYANQETGEVFESITARSSDYESHRAFISLSAGLVGTT